MIRAHFEEVSSLRPRGFRPVDATRRSRSGRKAKANDRLVQTSAPQGGETFVDR